MLSYIYVFFLRMTLHTLLYMLEFQIALLIVFAVFVDRQGRDSDFDCDSEPDDEATIAAQEREAGGDAAAVQQEIDGLRADQEVSIEELRRQYAGVGALSDGEKDDRTTPATPTIVAETDEASGANGADAGTKTVSLSRKTRAATTAAKHAWIEEKDTGEVANVHVN